MSPTGADARDALVRPSGVWGQRALWLALAPLLLAQGKYTSATTPRLPEPPGPRAGGEGCGPALRLLIAGDSAAAGVGVADQRWGLSGQLVAALTPHFAVQWRLIAQSGYTTGDLSQRLAREPAQAFDLAVLSLGVNDVTGAVRAGVWLQRQQTLAAQLRQRFGVRRVVFSSLPPMHRFSALPQPLRTALGARAQRFNALLADAIGAWPHCDLVTVTPPDGPEALACDGFHPGRSTYRHWAGQLAERIRGYADLGAAAPSSPWPTPPGRTDSSASSHASGPPP